MVVLASYCTTSTPLRNVIMVCALIPAKDDIDLLFGALRNAALVVHPLSLCLPRDGNLESC
jgi:hypothetical protein